MMMMMMTHAPTYALLIQYMSIFLLILMLQYILTMFIYQNCIFKYYKICFQGETLKGLTSIF
jgi:hypothetical protein